jgi:hypothetical protein
VAQSLRLKFSDHCRDCGGIFSVDEVISDGDILRLHLVIENTGEHGDLELLLESTQVFLFDSEEAASWVKSYAQLWAKEQIWLKINEMGAQKADRFLGLRAVDGTKLPFKLTVGARWDGWFENVRQPLPEDSVALMAVIGMFSQEKPNRLMNHLTHHRTRPFISLSGEDVTVEPLGGLPLFIARLQASLRTILAQFWNLSVLITIAGAILGTLVGIILFRDLAFMFTFLGSLIGMAIYNLYYRYKSGR